MKNMINLNEFKNKKEGSSLIESVIKIGNDYQVTSPIIIPKGLISAFSKKIKDETGKIVSEEWSDQNVAEALVRYVTTSYMTIENLPISALLGGDESTEAVQPIQTQIQTQPIQTQGQTQDLQPDTDTQSDVELSAQEIPAQPQPDLQSGVQTIQAQ